jgi:hypothetical protein
VYDEVKEELKLRGGYIMSPEECKKAGATIIKDGRLNAGAHIFGAAQGLLLAQLLIDSPKSTGTSYAQHASLC